MSGPSTSEPCGSFAQDDQVGGRRSCRVTITYLHCFTKILKENSHTEGQLSSVIQPSFHSASLELFVRDLLRNQRCRLGLPMGITLVGLCLGDFFGAEMG